MRKGVSPTVAVLVIVIVVAVVVVVFLRTVPRAQLTSGQALATRQKHLDAMENNPKFGAKGKGPGRMPGRGGPTTGRRGRDG